MKYYAVKKETYKNNSKRIFETEIYRVLYKTYEDAVRAALNFADKDVTLLGHTPEEKVGSWFTSTYSTCAVKCGKTKTTYHYKWEVIEFIG